MKLVIMLLCLFIFALFPLFGFIYNCIYQNGLKGEIEYNGRILRGATIPIPTFFMSDAYNVRRQIAAMNDLRAPGWLGDVQPISWQSFEMRYSPTPDPKLNDAMKSLEESSLRGLTSRALVFEKIPMYPEIQYKFWTNEISGYKAQQRFGDSVFVGMRTTLLASGLMTNAEIDRLCSDLMKPMMARQGGLLVNLTSELRDVVTKYVDGKDNREKVELAIYDYLFSGFAQAIRLDFSSLREKIGLSDFMYFSVVGGTTTGYGDIIPVSRLARLINGLQIILTYCSLVFLTSAIWAWFTAKSNLSN